MKKVILILSLVFLFVGCSDEPSPGYVKFIGSVNFWMTRIYEDGNHAGMFQVTHYLADMKIELLSQGKVIETTNPKVDSTMDMFYMLTKAEKNKEYQIRISLNDSMVKISKPFVIHDSDMKYYSPFLFNEDYKYTPSWLEAGYYYRDFLSYKGNAIAFIIEDTTGSLYIRPNPAPSSFAIHFAVPVKGLVEVDILDIKLNLIKNLLNENLEAGVYEITDPNIIPDGLYIARLKREGEILYYAFLKSIK